MIDYRCEIISQINSFLPNLLWSWCFIIAIVTARDPPNPSQIVPPTENNVFKHMSLSMVTVLILITTDIDGVESGANSQKMTISMASFIDAYFKYGIASFI